MALNRKKKIIIAVAAIVVLALVVIISVVATRKEQPEVTTVKVDVRPELRSTVTASGEVRPIRYIKLTSEVPGRILEIYVNPGDQVNKGQSLVRVDPTQLQSSQEAQWAATQASINDVQNSRNAVSSAQQSLVVAEAGVSQAKQEVVTAQIELKTAERELKRATNLVEANVMSRAEYDAARERKKKTIAIVIVCVLVAGAFAVWWFRYWPQERIVSRFFDSLQAKDYKTAYGIWNHDPQWEQHPQNFTQYPFNDFYRDWGPGGDWGLVKEHHVDCAAGLAVPDC